MQHQAITLWLDAYTDYAHITQCLLVPSPYLYWMALERTHRGHTWLLASQDVDIVLDDAPVTGALLSEMLQDCGVNMVLVGHEETRKLRHVSSFDIQNTIRGLPDSMQAVLCINDQDNLMDLLPEAIRSPIYIAYEPSASIGAETPSEVHQIEDRIGALDEIIKKRYNDLEVVWLYGGSVRAQTIGPLAEIQKLRGFLVGRASLNTTDWRALIQCI